MVAGWLINEQFFLAYVRRKHLPLDSVVCVEHNSGAQLEGAMGDECLPDRTGRVGILNPTF